MRNRTQEFERGLSVVEVLVAISLLAISGLSVAQSTIRSFAHLSQSYRTSVASQIALEHLELIAQRDPSTLGATENESSTTVIQSGLTFYRSTVISVNGDGSRTISVSVTSPTGLTGRASLSTTLPLWGDV
jgi:Tfp pilus assembly protein PilV